MVISNFHSCIYYTDPSLMKIGENTRFPKSDKRKYVFFLAPKSENIYRKVESWHALLRPRNNHQGFTVFEEEIWCLFTVTFSEKKWFPN